MLASGQAGRGEGEIANASRSCPALQQRPKTQWEHPFLGQEGPESCSRPAKGWATGSSFGQQ